MSEKEASHINICFHFLFINDSNPFLHVPKDYSFPLCVDVLFARSRITSRRPYVLRRYNPKLRKLPFVLHVYNGRKKGNKRIAYKLLDWQPLVIEEKREIHPWRLFRECARKLHHGKGSNDIWITLVMINNDGHLLPDGFFCWSRIFLRPSLCSSYCCVHTWASSLLSV